MSSTDFSENALVEQPAIALFEDLGYATANCFYEKVGGPTATLRRGNDQRRDPLAPAQDGTAKPESWRCQRCDPTGNG